MHFDGETYEPEHDKERLSTLLDDVRQLMLDEQWRTLGEILAAINRGSEASISARLRDLRKERFGSYEVDRRRRGEPKDGLHEYRLCKPPIIISAAEALEDFEYWNENRKVT